MAGLILSGARPIYFPVDYLEYPGLQAGLSAAKVEEVLKTEPDCKAVFAVSPTYHGLCSDISSIAETAHKKGIPLLVDEAHGAHCYFSELLPNTALAQNADACAQSLHKVAGALTQSSRITSYNVCYTKLLRGLCFGFLKIKETRVGLFKDDSETL